MNDKFGSGFVTAPQGGSRHIVVGFLLELHPMCLHKCGRYHEHEHEPDPSNVGSKVSPSCIAVWIFQKQLYEQSVQCEQQSASMNSVDASAESPMFRFEGLPAERINTDTEVVTGLQVKITVSCDVTPCNLAYTRKSHSNASPPSSG